MRAFLLALLLFLPPSFVLGQPCNSNAIGAVQIQCAAAKTGTDPAQVQTCQSSLGSLWADCEKQYRAEGRPFPPPVTNEANPSRVVFNLLDQFGNEQQRKIYQDLQAQPPSSEATIPDWIALTNAINRAPPSNNAASSPSTDHGPAPVVNRDAVSHGVGPNPVADKSGQGVDADAASRGGPAPVGAATERAVRNNDLPGMVKAAGDFVKNGRPQEAEALLGKMHELNPSNPQILEARARLRINLGDPEGAKEDAKMVLKLDPKNELAQFVAGHDDTLGRARGKIGRAKLDFSAAQDVQAPGARGAVSDARGGPDREHVPAAGAIQASRLIAAGNLSASLADGWAKFRIGDMKGAVDAASRALAKDPADSGALALRAAAYNRMGKPELALADADAALQTAPGDVAALLERGYAEYQLARYAEALSDVESALRIDSVNAMGHLYRGMILEKLDRVQEAVIAYLKAAELDSALKPLADEALARIDGATGRTGAVHPSRSGANVAFWAIVLLAALALLLRGALRAVKPAWATPVTPAR